MNLHHHGSLNDLVILESFLASFLFFVDLLNTCTRRMPGGNEKIFVSIPTEIFIIIVNFRKFKAFIMKSELIIFTCSKVTLNGPQCTRVHLFDSHSCHNRECPKALI